MYTLRSYSPHYRQLLLLGSPIVVGQIGNMVLSFADTLMIGHYGMRELAAASFVNSMVLLIVIFSMGFSYGLTPVVGRMVGRGEHGAVGAVVRAGVAANLLLAVLLVAVALGIWWALPLLGQPEELLPLMSSYLLIQVVSLPFVCVLNVYKQFFDAIGHTVTPMLVIVAGNVLNIAGNYVLIYGHFGLPALGLDGAGIATLLSRAVMALTFVVLFFAFRRYRPFACGFVEGGSFADHFRTLNRLGWPIALQMSMETAAFSLTSVLVGWMGARALAAHQVVTTLSQLFFMIYYGLAAAVSIRVSHFVGQRDAASARRVAAAGFHLVMLTAVIVAVPFLLLRHHIGALFTDDAEVCAIVSQLAVLIVIYQFGDGLQITYSNALRGLACVRSLVCISFICFFVTSLLLSWLLGIRMGYGLLGVWGAFPISLTLAGAMYYWRFRVNVRHVKQ